MKKIPMLLSFLGMLGGTGAFADTNKFRFSGQCKVDGVDIGSFQTDSDSAWTTFASFVTPGGRRYETTAHIWDGTDRLNARLTLSWLVDGEIRKRNMIVFDVKPGNQLILVDQLEEADGVTLNALYCEGLVTK
jgi:hypothetical protein